MKTYQEMKENARQNAVEMQRDYYHMSELLKDICPVTMNTEYLKRLGKRYGLLKEFRENDII